ncbi:MAG: DUF6481 family protein, partial [Pseudolabrys sp.]
MSFNTPNLHDRQNEAAAAKKALLEKFRTAVEDPALAEKRAAREAIAKARAERQAQREAEREAARRAREAKL